MGFFAPICSILGPICRILDPSCGVLLLICRIQSQFLGFFQPQFVGFQSPFAGKLHRSSFGGGGVQSSPGASWVGGDVRHLGVGLSPLMPASILGSPLPTAPQLPCQDQVQAVLRQPPPPAGAGGSSGPLHPCAVVCTPPSPV